ncbi:hypothetical protein ASD10_17330 [Aeromicrobium sp. Root472D3]|nr:hypothetical protein ASD10_17330 [Aeromicrobium sp. Root472D3]
MSHPRSSAVPVIAFLALVVGLVLAPSVVPAAQAEAADEWILVSPPDIWGTPRVGESLGANQGEWRPGPYAAKFTWLRDGTTVLESSSYSSYDIQPEDEGHMISARVTVTHPELGERTTTTAQIGPIDADRPLYAPDSPVLGLPHPGHTLDANPAPWVTDGGVVVPDVDVAYQWIRSVPNQDNTDEAIPGATQRTYTPTPEDLGWSIRATLTGTKPGYYSYPVTKYAGVIVVKVQNLSVPTVGGDAVVGSVLTGRQGTWVPSVESEYFRLSFQWLRDGTELPRATSPDYLLTDADAGRQVSLRVTGNAYGYFPHCAAATSLPTAVRARPIVSPPAPIRPVVSLTGRSTKRGAATLTIRVTPRRAATATILDGRKTVKRAVKVTNGIATVRLTRLKKGRHTFTVRYAAQPGVMAASARVTVRVR